MKRFLLSILMVVIGLSAFSQSPSFISLRPAYPLVIGESASDGVVLSNNGLFIDDILLDSLPTYEIGEIIDQTVRNADGLHGFYVKADSLHSTNVIYSYEVSGAPQGRIVFNEATGRFLYFPTEDEYMPFVVTFSATNGTDDLSEEVIFNLKPVMVSEADAFNTTGTMPDAGDYTIVAETATSKYFNYEERTVYSYSISGKNVIFDDAVKNKLWCLSGREDIYELNIYAERLIVRSAISFPGANVTIYARTVIFEDKGSTFASINITPPSKVTLTDGEAENGINAGSITLFVKDFKANGGIRLIANGSKGQSTNRNGTPGLGGNGGTITSNIDISSFCDFVRGSGGVKYDVVADGSTDTGPVIEYGTEGLSGRFVPVDRPYTYLHPYYVSAVMRYANDAFINNYVDEVYQTCQEYHALIDEALGSSTVNDGVNEGQTDDLDNVLGSRRNSPDIGLDDAEDGTEVSMGLQSNLTEMDKMLFKLNQGLDYFGNPVGWTPLLSFEVMRLNYENEIERAIKTLYLYYWLNDKDRTLQEKVDASLVAANTTEQEISDNQEVLNSLVLEIPKLQDEANDIANQIDVLTKKIESVRQQLWAKAKKIVKKRNRWKKFFNIAKTVASVIPAVGPVSTAVNVASNLVYAAGAIGNAFGSSYDYSDVTSVLESVGSGTIDFKGMVNNVKTAISGVTVQNLGTNKDLLKNTYDDISKAINPLTSKITNVIGIISKSSTPTSEVEVEFNKLLASSTVYRDLKNQVEELNQKKEALVAHMNEVFSDMTSTVSDLSNNILALDAFRRDAFAGNSKRDLNAMLYLENMKQRSKNRLLLYDYYLRKAYEYRMLTPYSGEFNLTGMFDRIEGMASAGESAVISNSNYTALAEIFEERISDITQAIVSDFTVERTAEVTYKLTKEQINALNAGDDITMNFYEDINTLRNKDNVRIVDIDISNLGKHVVGNVESSGTMELCFAHSGISKFRKDGDIFWFNHKTKNSANPHKWKMSYDAISGTMTPHKPSPASLSLLSSLVGSNQIMYFSRPSAWSDMTLSKSVDTDFADIVIDSLTVKITYDYTDRKDGMYYIDIATNEELMPYISCTDSKGKSGGYGRLHKAYSSSQPVTFTAIGQYESFHFKNWTDRAGNVASSNTSLTVNKKSDQFYIANYEYRGPELSVPDTIYINNDGGSFTVNVRNIGMEGDEMDWYVSDSLSTFVHIDDIKEGVDDGTFTLTCEANPTGGRRVDTIEILAPEAYTTIKTVYIVQVDEVIEATDISKLANAIYIEPFKVGAGAETGIGVRVKNASTITSYGFELVLPEGISIETESDGSFDDAVTLSSRHKGHVVTTNKLTENTYKIGVASLNSKSLSDNDGLVLTIRAKVADDMALGMYAVKVVNPLIVESNGTKPNVEETVTTVTVGDYMPGDVDGDGMVDLADAVLVINHYVGKPLLTFISGAADVDSDGVIDLADAVRIINYYVGKITSLSRRLLEKEHDPQ